LQTGTNSDLKELLYDRCGGITGDRNLAVVILGDAS
jgi:NADH:ubiquinone oxidoreductase subunit F (NADH-binding)